MKKILFTFLVMVTSLFGYSQSYLPLTGGTLTGPLVGTNAAFQNYILANWATATNTTSTSPLIYSSTTTGSAYPYLEAGNLIIQSRASGADRDILFVTGSTPATRMLIGRTGNVGIGTSSPNYLLSVGGNATSVSTGEVSIQSFPTVTSGFFANHVSQLVAAPPASSAAIYYGVLGETGDGTGVSYNFTNSSSMNAVAGQIVHRGTGNINTAISLLAGGETISNGGTITNAYGLYVGTVGVNGVTNSYGVYQSSATDPNYFAGNVSIGTTTTHGYKFAVNGNAIATAMTVQLYTSWPDYVFKPQYKLPTLSDVKTYIVKNRHLPEMPTEAEVIQNGINLGEMNTLLTKKVEELTLYLIEQQKSIQQLQQQITEVRKSLKKTMH